MPLKKAHEIYESFEDWVTAHQKHSSLSVQYALRDSLEIDPEKAPTESLKSYIKRLQDMRLEISSEIREAKDWIEYLGRHGR
jgi:hypothetical protein